MGKTSKYVTVKGTRIDKDYILARGLFYKMINAERNKDILDSVPHIPFLDLAAVYCLPISEDKDMVGSLTIPYELCEFLDIDPGSLWRLVTRPIEYEMLTLDNAMRTLFDLPDDGCEDMPIYILTAENKMFGASVLLYSQYFADLANKLDRNLYILPSSIHEVIVLPESYDGEDFAIDELIEMVRDVNANVVRDQDFLSDNVYFYDRTTGKITIA